MAIWMVGNSAQSSLSVTHPSTNRARRYLTSVTEPPSKHWSPPRTSIQQFKNALQTTTHRGVDTNKLANTHVHINPLVRVYIWTLVVSFCTPTEGRNIYTLKVQCGDTPWGVHYYPVFWM